MNRYMQKMKAHVKNNLQHKRALGKGEEGQAAKNTQETDKKRVL